MFRIEMLPAAQGDCLLISYGKPDAIHYILIDGGPYYFYADKDKKKLGKRETLTKCMIELSKKEVELDLMVVTHIDGDHIEALVKWMGSAPNMLPIKDFWFNGRRQLEPGWLGVQEGEFLGKLIEKYDIPWNDKFDGHAIVRNSEGVVEKELDGGMKLTILSPTAEELVKLHDEWDEVLEKENLDTDDPEAILERLDHNARLKPEPIPDGWLGLDIDQLADSEFKEDNATPNGSSIAFLAEYEGKSALFTGDAHPSVLAAGIRQLLEDRNLSKLALDGFKIPHHGSKNNINSELLQLLDCRRYLISTDGSYYHHPDQEAIARILKYGTREFGNDSYEKAELCFNYQKPSVSVWDDSDLKYNYNYETHFPKVPGDSLVIDL
ncbi:MAG TPA: hypothetical protein VGK23_03725 [Methanomassiliicoccales archaeon]|jgi:beta-lactamase superfamily II metal-dependent hydrolase